MALNVPQYCQNGYILKIYIKIQNIFINLNFDDIVFNKKNNNGRRIRKKRRRRENRT